jgi:hypothetical protein
MLYSLYTFSMAFEYKVRSPRYCFDPRRHGPKSTTPYAVSRSKIDLFTECPRCFYLDQRLGIKRPDSYPLTLNIAVDELLKREFDLLRAEGKPHALMKDFKIDAVPFSHEDLETWRDSLRNGIKYLHPETNLIVRGGIDDVWINADEELHVVDYKATSKREEVTLDAPWQDAYKRQVEVYQWLFRKNGFTVSPTAYFVYANGNADAEKFDARLEFDITIISYDGNDDWVDERVTALHACLMDEHTPEPSSDCVYCTYREIAGKTLLKEYREKKAKEK